jgi:hypothetical protein
MTNKAQALIKKQLEVKSLRDIAKETGLSFKTIHNVSLGKGINLRTHQTIINRYHEKTGKNKRSD